MDDNVREYTNGEITVVWQPKECIHSKICWEKATGLPEVFNPQERPWINMAGAVTGRIITQVNKCPTGALSYFFNSENEPDDVEKVQLPGSESDVVVQIMKNGPLIIYGNFILKDTSGNETRKMNATSFCRCGASKTNPLCDGTHQDIHFEG